MLGWMGQVGQHQVGVPETGNHVLLGCVGEHCGQRVDPSRQEKIPNKRVGVDVVMLGATKS